ncbi:ABC transporter permease [Paenibacillus abyssi]|uniref:Multiple-sugar transport system permease YteP n=1 Tax=Paenibacillus abyssi TaxID=1340531 RepID=A0A917CWT9_9BACL|nr:ABC transporter permease subunit [Paenibacillus abyssi]GGG00444.1 putative multiple-sugar transport system permease YteP [Paenibacillus abyssi]
MNRKGLRTAWRPDWILYLFLLPGVLYFIVFKYLPMYGIIIAFQDYSPFKGVSGSDFVGLKHFIRFFEDDEFITVFRNTLLISFYKLAFGFPVPILIALMLNEVRKSWFKRTAQTLFYIPHFFSWVIFGGIVIQALSSKGMINSIITLFGGDPILFMAEKEYFRSILVISDIIKESGWASIIYLAAISGVNPSLYEAARMDGAKKRHEIFYITLPSISSTIIILFILQLGNILELGVQQVFMLYNPLVYEVGDIIDTYVYRVGLTEQKYSFATAVGLFQATVGLILIYVANGLAKRFSGGGLW